MNRAELLARYMEYDHDLEVIESRDFYEFVRINDIKPEDIKHWKPMPSTDVMEASIDGWRYCSYGTVYTVGWQGDHDVDGFCFRVKEMTQAERDNLMSIFTRENDYTETDCAIGDDNTHY